MNGKCDKVVRRIRAGAVVVVVRCNKDAGHADAHQKVLVA